MKRIRRGLRSSTSTNRSVGIIALSIFSACNSLAQPATFIDSSDSHISIILGIGPNYGFKNESTFSEMASVRYEYLHWNFGLRYLHGNGSLYGSVPDENIDDIGLVIGYNYKQHRYSISGGVGISYAVFVIRGKFLDSAYSNSIGDIAAIYEEIHSHSISIPMQAEAFWTPSDLFGMGIIFFDNINTVKNNYGFLISLKLNVI